MFGKIILIAWLFSIVFFLMFIFGCTPVTVKNTSKDIPTEIFVAENDYEPWCSVEEFIQYKKG